MIDDPHVVTTESVLERGRFFRRVWIAGWLFSSLCLFAVGYVCGRDSGRQECIADIERLSGKVRLSAALQERSTIAFVKAWEDQRQNVDLVTSWAEYVRDRADLANSNEGVVIPRPRKVAKKQ